MPNSKIIMMASSLFMGLLGIAAIFFPMEFLNGWLISPELRLLFIVQIAGALYIGFSIQNWIGKSNVIGGIYGRPIAIGNFTHFFIGCLTILKFIINSPLNLYIDFVGLGYSSFAIFFGLLLFRSTPDLEKQSKY